MKRGLDVRKKLYLDNRKKKDILNDKYFYSQSSLQKFFLLLTLTFLLAFTFISTNIVSAQETLYCAEKTVSGAWCQNVPLDEVNTNYRYDRTSCESTAYCSKGTCVNIETGECLPGPQATCNSDEGGFFYNEPKEDVAQCRVGCCLLGDGAALVERVRCDVLGKDYDVKATFRQDITDEITCLALASPEAKGSCVLETERGRECRFTTRGECPESENQEFSEGFLCSNPDLGTVCAKTERTTCVSGENEVYFVDSCGNLGNVYDANKINNVAYWSFVPGVEGVEVDFGNGQGNKESQIYGACDYLQGSTCGPGNAKFGRNICVDLGCKASSLTGGIKREHGDEWCSQSIDSFEDATPGEISYLLYCYNGEVQYELCDGFRNKLCLENIETGTASCVANRWQECLFINNTKDCLDENVRDCEVIEGASAVTLRTGYGVEKQILDSDSGETIIGTCVPKYTPGFKFWDPEGTILDTEEGDNPLSMCEFSSVTCFVNYTQEIIGLTAWRPTPEDSCVETCKAVEGWSNSECYKACTPVCLENLDGKNANATIVGDWAQSYQNLCTAIGDCGISENYLGKEGYDRWRDLFTGEKIDWSSLPNANSRK